MMQRTEVHTLFLLTAILCLLTLNTVQAGWRPRPYASKISGEEDVFECTGDVGFDGLSCGELKDALGNSKLCKNFAKECCDFCGDKCKGNKDAVIQGTTYTCEDALVDVFQGGIDAMCRVFGKDCCELCT